MTKYQPGGAFTFQDYQSVYTPTGQLEIGALMRQRYDENQESHDLIERALATIETSPGDAHLVTKVKQEIDAKLKNLVATGAYEKSGAILNEAQNLLQNDKGLMLASQSMEIRKDELKRAREYSLTHPGSRILSFGDETWNNHVSYYVGDGGEIIENVYQPSTEIAANYSQEMRQMLSKISASTGGVSTETADMIGELMFNSYLGQFADDPEFSAGDLSGLTGGAVGRQDYKRLMEIDLVEKFPNMQERHDAAIADIKKRIQFETYQFVHLKETTPNTPSSIANKYPHLVNPESSIETRNYNVEVPVIEDVGGWLDILSEGGKSTQSIVDYSEGYLEDLQSGIPKEDIDNAYALNLNLRKKIIRDVIMTSPNINGSKADREKIANEYIFYTTDLYSKDPSFGALVEYMTTPTDNFDWFDSEGGDPFEFGNVVKDIGIGIGAGTGKSILQRWNPFNKLNAISFKKIVAISAISSIAEELIDWNGSGFSNVSDYLRTNQLSPDATNWGKISHKIKNTLNPVDNEEDAFRDQFASEGKIEQLNNLLGSNYEGNEYLANLIDMGVETQKYLTNGGDWSSKVTNIHGESLTGADIQKLIFEEQQLSFESELVQPNWVSLRQTKPDGWQTSFEKLWDEMPVTNFDVANIAGVVDWSQVIDIPEGKSIADVKANIIGVIYPDLITGTAPMFFAEVQVDGTGGGQFLLKPKASTGSDDLIHQYLKEIDRDDIIRLDIANNTIANLKKERLKAGQPTGITGRDMFQSIAASYGNDQVGLAVARDYLVNSFITANFEIFSSVEEAIKQGHGPQNNNGEYMSAKEVIWQFIQQGGKYLDRDGNEKHMKPYLNVILR